MNNIKNTISKNFTIVPNALIDNSKITDRARFLFVFMASKPDDWEFKNYHLSKAIGYSIDTLRKYLKELQEFGWISKIQQTRIDGQFGLNTYIMHASPVSNPPCRKNTDTVKNRHGKKNTPTNKEYYKKRKKTHKYSFEENKKNKPLMPARRRNSLI